MRSLKLFSRFILYRQLIRDRSKSFRFHGVDTWLYHGSKKMSTIWCSWPRNARSWPTVPGTNLAHISLPTYLFYVQFNSIKAGSSLSMCDHLDVVKGLTWYSTTITKSHNYFQSWSYLLIDSRIHSSVSSKAKIVDMYQFNNYILYEIET